VCYYAEKHFGVQFYYEGTNAIIFVVDSMDPTRYELSKAELTRLLSASELRGVPVLVYANKQVAALVRFFEILTSYFQDVAGTACGPDAVMKNLGLDNIRDRAWYCQGCSGVTGAGLYEGMDWLTTQLKAQQR
jgi:hypothetical protein